MLYTKGIYYMALWSISSPLNQPEKVAGQLGLKYFYYALITNQFNLKPIIISVQEVVTKDSGIFYWDFLNLNQLVSITHGHNISNTNLKPKFLFYLGNFQIIAIVFWENTIIQREVNKVLIMGGTAPIRYDYYSFEVTSINQIVLNIDIATLSYLITMDVFGNIRIYEIISLPYEYYQAIFSLIALGISG